MKNIIYIFVLTALIFGCSTNDDDNSNDILLDITAENWQTQVTNQFGSVHLTITGRTNADKLMVRTFGDGIIQEKGIEIDENNNFSETVTISFTLLASPYPDDDFYSNTVLTIIKGSKRTEITLESPALNWYNSQQADIFLEFDTKIWYTEISDNFGFVHLSISGSTDAEKLFVRTYGDGITNEKEIELICQSPSCQYPLKTFTDNIIISFTHAPTVGESFYSSTVVTADNSEFILNSPLLSW